MGQVVLKRLLFIGQSVILYKVKEGLDWPHLPPSHEDSVEPSAQSCQGLVIALSYEPEDETSINQQGHIAEEEEELQVSRKCAYTQSSNYEPLLVPETPIWPLQEAGSLSPSSGTCAQGGCKNGK